MSLTVLTIGKLKNKELEKLCLDYEKRINSPSLKIIEIKPSSENPEKEANDAIKKLSEVSSGNAFHILLTEWGKKFNSVDFSKWLQTKIENHSHVSFVIAGAEGPHQALKEFCHGELSLSELTYPHKLARLVLVEQLYRAQTIRQGHPYHN